MSEEQGDDDAGRCWERDGDNADLWDRVVEVGGKALHYAPDGTPCTLREWTRYFADPLCKRVAFDQWDSDAYCYELSTVYDGMDHDIFGVVPLIYETMLFVQGAPDRVWRWPTRDAAIAGHRMAADEVRQELGRGPDSGFTIAEIRHEEEPDD